MGAANESALLVRGYHRRHCAMLGTDDHEHQGSGLQVFEGLVLPDVGDDVHEFVHAPDLYAGFAASYASKSASRLSNHTSLKAAAQEIA